MRKARTNRVKRTKGRSNNRTKRIQSRRTSKSKKSRTKKSLKSNTDLKKFKKLEKKLEKLYVNNASKREIDKTSKQLANLQKKMIKANKKRMKGGVEGEGIQKTRKAENERYLNKIKRLIIERLRYEKELQPNLDLRKNTDMLEEFKTTLLEPQTSVTMADKRPDHTVTIDIIDGEIENFIKKINSMDATALKHMEEEMLKEKNEENEGQPNPGDAPG